MTDVEFAAFKVKWRKVLGVDIDELAGSKKI